VGKKPAISDFASGGQGSILSHHGLYFTLISTFYFPFSCGVGVRHQPLIVD
jgi:hypothetical protein